MIALNERTYCLPGQGAFRLNATYRSGDVGTAYFCALLAGVAYAVSL
jgi:hypothetical protein